MQKDTYAVVSLCPGTVLVPFSFAPNGSSAVTQSTIIGDRAIASVTRAGVGDFDIVVRDDYAVVLGFLPSVQLATTADVTVSDWDYAPTTNTLRIQVRSGGSAADIAANANNRVGGFLVCKNTSLPY